MKTAAASKQALMQSTERDMQSMIQDMELSDREKLALTCRILFDKGHDSGLAGQITCRTGHRDTFLTQRLGLGFDEITADNLITVDHDLKSLAGEGMPNPANRFHTWIYKEHSEVNCIIHTHPTHVAALAMLEVPLQISQMDVCALYDDCSFVADWPGVPVGNEEGVLISNALGNNRAVFLSHHGPTGHRQDDRRGLQPGRADRARGTAAAACDGCRRDQAAATRAGPRSTRLGIHRQAQQSEFCLLRTAGA